MVFYFRSVTDTYPYQVDGGIGKIYFILFSKTSFSVKVLRIFIF